MGVLLTVWTLDERRKERSTHQSVLLRTPQLPVETGLAPSHSAAEEAASSVSTLVTVAWRPPAPPASSRPVAKRCPRPASEPCPPVRQGQQPRRRHRKKKERMRRSRSQPRQGDRLELQP